jgi:hypothetical protein
MNSSINADNSSSKFIKTWPITHEWLLGFILISFLVFTLVYSALPLAIKWTPCNIERVECLKEAYVNTTATGEEELACVEQSMTVMYGVRTLANPKNYTTFYSTRTTFAPNCTALTLNDNVCNGTFYTKGNTTYCSYLDMAPFYPLARPIPQPVFGKVGIGFASVLIAEIILNSLIQNRFRLLYLWRHLKESTCCYCCCCKKDDYTMSLVVKPWEEDLPDYEDLSE